MTEQNDNLKEPNYETAKEEVVGNDPVEPSVAGKNIPKPIIEEKPSLLERWDAFENKHPKAVLVGKITLGLLAVAGGTILATALMADIDEPIEIPISLDDISLVE